MMWFRCTSGLRYATTNSARSSVFVSVSGRFPFSSSTSNVSTTTTRRNFLALRRGTCSGYNYNRDSTFTGKNSFSSSSAATDTTTTTTNNNNNTTVDNPSIGEETNNYEFKAETRQLLDIVTHSLYTDREVFLRELVSNASDACEKLRHLQAANMITTSNNQPKTTAATTDEQEDLPLEIRITTNEVDQTLTIADTGIGFTKDDMIKNLGTIAASGSKAFVQALKARAAEDKAGVTSASQGIIGKFGVGFYSSFMVGDVVHVRSR
jgi:hypothetical protein